MTYEQHQQKTRKGVKPVNITIPVPSQKENQSSLIGRLLDGCRCSMPSTALYKRPQKWGMFTGHVDCFLISDIAKMASRVCPRAAAKNTLVRVELLVVIVVSGLPSSVEEKDVCVMQSELHGEHHSLQFCFCHRTIASASCRWNRERVWHVRARRNRPPEQLTKGRANWQVGEVKAKESVHLLSFVCDSLVQSTRACTKGTRIANKVIRLP